MGLEPTENGKNGSRSRNFPHRKLGKDKCPVSIE